MKSRLKELIASVQANRDLLQEILDAVKSIKKIVKKNTVAKTETVKNEDNVEESTTPPVDFNPTPTTECAENENLTATQNDDADVLPPMLEPEENDPFVASLKDSQYRKAYDLVLTMPDMQKRLFSNSTSDEENEPEPSFVQFVAKVANRDGVVNVWEVVSKRCKSEKTEATEDEMCILEVVVEIYNMTTERAKIEFVKVEKDEDYASGKHDDVAPTRGRKIEKQLCVGLKQSNNDTVVKPVIVMTYNN